MSGHTPGPWELGFCGKAVPTKITKNARMYMINQANGDAAGIAFVASWVAKDSDSLEANSNANLISAAPDLLDSLDKLMTCLDSGPDRVWSAIDLHDARMAIKKAKGLTQ